jgi:hypothetical protein
MHAFSASKLELLPNLVLEFNPGVHVTYKNLIL